MAGRVGWEKMAESSWSMELLSDVTVMFACIPYRV